MSIGEIVAVATFVVLGGGVIWRTSYMLNRKVSYESFDRLKREITDNYVHKEVFELTYDQVKSDISEIKTDIKQLLKKANGKGGG